MNAAAWTAARAALSARQASRLAALVDRVVDGNAFYTHKYATAGLDARQAVASAGLAGLPFTTKAELIADQDAHAPWGTAHTEPIAAYTRYHQTSSTTGRPLRWIDTNASWQWALDCWKSVFAAARVGPGDRVLFAFSFGPFLGFWTAFEAGCQIGAHCVPGGGMTSHQRLALIDAVRPGVLCCTPTYAPRLAEVAEAERGHAPLTASGVRTIIVAGESGGSLPVVRARIERAWGARVIDHYGLTEVGPVAFEDWNRPGGLYVNEAEFIAEVLDADGAPVPDGELGELVLTNLGRTASPVIRYRTGDIVRARTAPHPNGPGYLWLEGGILARADDMVTIRGVNVYPTAVEAVVRENHDVTEFRATVARESAMRHLTVEIEVRPATDGAAVAHAVSLALKDALGLTVAVHPVAVNALPRFEMKARRFVITDV
ncbi:MAG: AMP-binding protein [Vicinamibacteraceae bacterium]